LFQINAVSTIDLAARAIIKPGMLGYISRGMFYLTTSSVCISADKLELSYYNEDKEEYTMGRRIGNFVNPQNGEPDWLEPETVSMIILQPQMVTRVGEVSQSSIEFKLTENEENKTIDLVAEYSVGNNKYTSEPIKMQEDNFSEEFSKIVYEDKALDDSDIIKETKSEAIKNLTAKLLDNGIMIGGMQFNGFGLVVADKDKVMTIESLDFNYTIEDNRGVRTVKLYNCVGQVSLKNLERPDIKFYTGTHKISLIDPQVTASQEGRLKDYTLTVRDFKLNTDATMPEHKIYDKINANNDDFLDEFIMERKSLLDDVIDRDEDLDDRFSDFF
jgi:hypothetical protein